MSLASCNCFSSSYNGFSHFRNGRSRTAHDFDVQLKLLFIILMKGNLEAESRVSSLCLRSIRLGHGLYECYCLSLSILRDDSTCQSVALFSDEQQKLITIGSIESLVSRIAEQPCHWIMPGCRFR